MAARVETATRKFMYDGKELADPGSDMTPEDVMEAYASQFVDLTNGVVQGPEIEVGSDVAVYTFTTVVGKHS